MKKFFGVLAVLILIAAVAVFLLMHFGLIGFGGGSGTGSSDADSSISSESESETEPVSETEPIETSVEEKVYVKVTVKENEYLYQNSTMTLDALTEALGQLDAEIIVRITDENASKQAFDALTAELDAAAITYELAE